MSVDVLAILDSVIQRSGHIVACDVVQARAAIAELIAADREYDEALSEVMDDFNVTNRYEAAISRRDAALAAVRCQRREVSDVG